MARKYELITELYQRTQKSVTAPEAWRQFLASACRNYRLSFDEQLLVYAQRPDAIAVLELEDWNRKFGRWVNKGATGIAVFDKEHTGRTRLKHFFDVTDTHESRFSRPVPLWEVQPEQEADIIEAIENSFGELADKSDFAAALLSAAKNAVEDNVPDYLSELHYYTQNSFLEELDEYNIEVLYKQALQSSVAYMLMTRCGIPADDYFSDDDFRDILSFNTPETLNALGTATGDIAQMGLSEIARTVRNLEKVQTHVREGNSEIMREPERELSAGIAHCTFAQAPKSGYPVSEKANQQPERSFEYGTELHDAGRLQPAEPASSARSGGSPWEIRLTAPEVSEGEPQNHLHESADQRQAEQPPDGNRADGAHPAHADDKRDGESRGRDGADESGRPDEVGRPDEQHSSFGGGSGSQGTDLQLTPQESEPQAKDDWQAEGVPVAQLNTTENADGSDSELPAFLDEKLIMAVIANKDDDLKYKKRQIELFYSIHPDEAECAAYLKSAYQDRYTEILVDGVRVGYKPQENGLLIWEGAYLSRTKESVFSWGVVAGLTAQIIDKKEYYINTDIKGLKSQNSQQMSLFDFADFNASSGEPEQVSLFPRFEVSQQIIDEALCVGANDEHSRLIICAYFMKDKADNPDFLREHYGTNGAGFYFNDRKISLWYDAAGIRIAEGETAQRSSATLVTWEQAAKRIRELLDLGRYIPQSELDRAADYERNKLAENLALTARDFSEEAIEAGYAPTIRLALSEKGGFPEIEKQVSTLLKDQEMLQKITDEWSTFVSAYEENRDLLRFRFYRPKKLLQQLTDLQREPVIFTAAEDYNPQRRFFISSDEIDKILRGGTNSTDYRLGVYSFYRNNSDKKEREKYLKDFHGEYSGSHGGNDSLTYQKGKGVSFSHGSIMEPYAKVELKWNAVEKRISSLISSGRFLSDEDKAAIPAYEKEQVARSVHNFFSNVSEDMPCPFPRGFDFWDGVKVVSELLDDPVMVEEIYQMMLPVWESTQQDDREYPWRKTGLENLTAYREGTFSLFNEKKEPHTIQADPPAKKETDPIHRLAVQLSVITRQFEPTGFFNREETEKNRVAWYAEHIQNPNELSGILDELRLNLDYLDPEEELAVDLELLIEELEELQEDSEQQTQREDIAGFLDEAGYVVSDEVIDTGISEYAAHGGKGDNQDIADYIEDEFLSEESEPDLSDITDELPTKKEASDLIGKTLRIDDRDFRVDSIDESAGSASLMDVTFQSGVGFPIFRRESLEFVRSQLESVKIKQELPAKKEIEIQPISSIDEQLRDLLKQVPKNAFNEIQIEAFQKDVEKLLLQKSGDSLVGITADEWVKKLLEMSPEEFGEYIISYQAGILDAFSALPQEQVPVLAPPKPKRERIRFTTLHPEIPKEQRQNFRITDKELGYGTPTEKYTANINAIRLLKHIEDEERLATPDEQEMLSRYVGWGGLSDCFEEQNSHYQELKSLLDEDEYNAARASSLTAFYTSPVITAAMYQALEQMGFQQGNILEPACGVGNFIGSLPDSMAESKAYGVEIDSISGRIARQLYQNSSIAVQGFEKVEMPDSFFDIAIGNVPFGDFKVLDKRYDKNHWLIHDYFFGKTLDKVRPGGIVAFITSKGTMDKENSSVRKYLAQRADLIGAIRLPDNAFKRNAGTEVTSDIIFLQKRDRMVDIEPDWVHLDTDENDIRMNSYFVQHPDMILGEMKMESTRFGMDSACKAYENADLAEQLQEAVSNLHAEITAYEVDELESDEDLSIPADPDVRNFSYTSVEGKLYFRENSRMHPVEASVTAENRIRGMIALRDCVRRLIEFQTEDFPESAIEREQEKLNSLYDAYVKKYDRLFTRGNNLAFCEDSSYCLLCSLEVLDEEGNFKRKADMFSKRTIKPHTPVTSVDTASEALAVSISEKARVDMEYMAALSGKTAEELETELHGVIFRDINCATDPDDIPVSFVDISRFPLVTADEYLSGNVRRKLQMATALAEALPAEKKSLIQQNISSLTTVQPVDLTAGEIGVRIGATWIPPEIYRQFMFELFGTGENARRRMNILYSKCTGEWNITEKNSDYGNIKATTTYGTKRISAYQIFEQTLNLKDVRVFDTVYEDGNEKRVLNKKETAIAQDRQELIKSKFTDWLWKDIDRREMLCKLYNETFNSVRPREYDGQHIRFFGMNPEIRLRPHQINAIAHIMYGGNTLLAHEVGAGKTFEMVAAAMESKRLGLCSKSLIVVPNHITEQWAAEWLQLYPSANILVATKKDFEKSNRKKFCGRIATGDYDAIIIGHSQFEKIPMSKERQEAILGRQIDELLYGIQEAKSAKAERYTIKQMEKTKKSLENRLEKLNDQSRKDSLVTFEELGVDRVFIDESHYFKNLFLMTKMRNVGGIAQTEAQKSSDLFMKCQYLDEITGGRGTIFATGTPISNSMVELYTIQRYLQYRTLQEMGLTHFDEWAANFGETVTAIELSPEGTGYRAKTRFAKFYNLPELMATFKEAADIQTADMLHLPVPKANFHTEVIKPTELQQEMIKGLAERAEEIRNGNVDPSVDNMLKITNDGRKLALDMRLMNPLAPDDENNKTSVCARNVYRIWEQSREQRSAQLVFCDLSTPKGDGSFNVYDDLKKKLIEKGIPEDEIAFIHEANTEARKKELFGKVRSGQVRVLMGSTQKMGAGTNVQDRLIALHDLDCPWRPSDLAQRLGRIVRQGNLNPEVEIFRYVTENTFDAYLYQLVENKQKFIAQIMTSKTPLRAAEDVDETALNYAEIKALATGNPLIIEKCNLDMEVGKLNMLKSNHLSQKYALEEMVLRKYPETITRLTERAAGYEQDIQLVSKHPKIPDGFTGMEILGTAHSEKESAGKAILDACTKMTGSDAVFLGQYRGFSLTLSYDGTSNEYRMTMKGTLSHTAVLGADVFGNITRMDNVLDGFTEKHGAVRDELENTKIQLENARAEMEAPFAKEPELTQKTARLKELNILLNMDQKDRSVLDGEPDEGNEAERQKKVVGLER